MSVDEGSTAREPLSLREAARRYVRQQDALYGAVVLPAARQQQSLQDDRRVTVSATDATTTTAPPAVIESVSDTLFPTPDVARGTSDSIIERLMLINEPWTQAPSLETLNHMICSCQQCGLGRTRKNFVFGVGNPAADIVVIGEAPGADEDAKGEPFVGAAGQLLNKILAAINLQREEVYICNILKCRPPGNRTPERAEVEQCEPYLLRQLGLIKPKFILALGLTAANTLLNRKAKMGELRGVIHDYHGIRLIVTYHPAALLRNPQWKRSTWDDVQMLRRLYDESMTATG